MLTFEGFSILHTGVSYASPYSLMTFPEAALTARR